MLGNMTEKPALSRLTYWEGGGKKIYCTPFVPRVLLTSLTLLLRRVKAHYFNCLSQQKAQTNPRHFANAILLILDVLLPIALNFYCFSFMRKKKKGFIALTMVADLLPTNPARRLSIDAKSITHLLFQLTYGILPEKLLPEKGWHSHWKAILLISLHKG